MQRDRIIGQWSDKVVCTRDSSWVFLVARGKEWYCLIPIHSSIIIILMCVSKPSLRSTLRVFSRLGPVSLSQFDSKLCVSETSPLLYVVAWSLIR